MSKRGRTVAEGWVPNQHGIPSSYIRGCRCDDCKAANAARQRRGGARERLQAKRFAERELIDGRLVHPDPYGGHGSLTANTQCGCQCDECRAAYNAWQRQNRAKRRAR